jgi:hypothetical protein
VTYPYIDGLDVDPKSQPQPVLLQGKVEVIAPHRIATFNLSMGDVGQTRSDANISLKLLSLEKNIAEIEVSNSAPLASEVAGTALNPLIVQAKDSTGQWLSRAGSINENAAQVAFYQKQLAKMQAQTVWSDAFEQQLKAEQLAFDQQQGRHYSKVYFNGTLESVEVNVLDFSQATVTRKDLQLPVRHFDPNTTEKIVEPLPMPVVVYDDQAPTWLKGANLSEDQLKGNVSISQSVEDATAARIEFDHLKTFNDELLGTSFNPGAAPLTFFTANDQGKRGEPIELPPEAYEIDPLQGTITYDLTLFPETPAFAVGSMPLFLARIARQDLDLQHLPKGLELKGNALVVDEKVFPAQEWRFFAKDDSGHYLKEVLSVSHDAELHGPPLFNVHYFYGQPTRLESYQRTDLDTVQYGFQVKLDKADTANLVQ